MPLYEKTLPDTIKDYLNKELPKGYFKIIFYGDPMNIPSSLLPCIAIEKTRTQITAGPTGMDKIVTTISINLMYNKKEDFGRTNDEMVGKRKHEEYAEAIDNESHEWFKTSVMGILRKNFTLGDVVLNQDIDINYGIVPRPGNELTAECQIRCSFTQLKVVSVRR